MKGKRLFGICLVITGSLGAADLRESTLVQVVNEVKVAPAGAAEKDARANDVVRAPDKIRTGTKSRAELKAPDNTLTRIGANTIFSFEQSGRVLNLEKGSVLFHSPAGRGGGTIKSAGASAAVLGTTLIVAATQDGGFKCLLLEGKGTITLPNGKTQRLEAGDMVYVPAGAQDLSVIKIDLGKLVGGSQLVNGFANPLPTIGDIRNEIAKQNIAIISGNYEETGLMIGGVATFKTDPKPLDPVLQQNATARPIFFLNREQPPKNRTGVVSVPAQNTPAAAPPSVERPPFVGAGGVWSPISVSGTTLVDPTQRNPSGCCP